MQFKTKAAQEAFEAMVLYMDLLWSGELPKGAVAFPLPDYSRERFSAYAQAVWIAARIDIEATAPQHAWIIDADGVRPAAAVMEPIRMQKLTRAVNAYCSCGGKGPDDSDACDVCRVWHYVERETAKATESGKNDGK